MNALKKTGKKGDYQYVQMEKKRRILSTALFFVFPILFLIAGILIWGDRMNVLTIVAVVLCLPAGKRLVSLIMILMYQTMEEEKYQKIEVHKGSLTMVYECILTNYEKNTFVDAFAICGNQVIGYTSSEKADIKYAEVQTQRLIRNNGYGVTVKILKDYNRFIERLDSLNEHEASLRADIPFTPDEKYPDLSREEVIKHTILAISL